MTIKQNVFSGGTNGADISTSNSGGASGDAFTGVVVSAGTLTYSNVHTIKGSLSAQVTGSGSGTSYASWSFAGKNPAARGYYWFDAATTTDTPIIWIGVGSTQVARLQRIGDGRLRAFTTAGTTVWTSASVPASGQFVRYEMRCVVGTTTANGELHGVYYLGDSTTPVEEFHLTGQNLGTVNVDQIRFGKAATSSYASTFWFGAIKADDNATAFLGPVPSSPPTVAVTGSDAYLIDATTSSTTGTPTYSIAQSSGSTLSPVQLSPGRWRVARDASTDRVYDVTVTDDAGTATAGFTVPKQVVASTGPRLIRRRMRNGVLT